MLINRDEAIAAVESMIDTRTAKFNTDAAFNAGLEYAAKALRTLPTVSVTDEMDALQAENAELNTVLAEQARVMDLWSAQLDTILEELKGRK